MTHLIIDKRACTHLTPTHIVTVVVVVVVIYTHEIARPHFVNSDLSAVYDPGECDDEQLIFGAKKQTVV